jgi:hypothetical protein
MVGLGDMILNAPGDGRWMAGAGAGAGPAAAKPYPEATAVPTGTRMITFAFYVHFVTIAP